MASYFADSSALVKRYVQERGSAWIVGLFTPFPHDDVHIVAVTPVEIVAALMRRSRSGTTTEADAAAACSQFLADLPLDYQVVEVTEAIINPAILLVQKYKLRGYDAMQLAAGCQINAVCIASGQPPLIFVSADKELSAAALGEGLSVEDPNLHL